MRHLFGPLRHLNFWEMAAFETNGGGGGGGGGGDDDNNTTTTTYVDTSNIAGISDASGVDYTDYSHPTDNDDDVDDVFGTGNIYTETEPGASTVNYGNTVNYSHPTDNDDDSPPASTPYNYVDTSNIAGISAASGVDYNPTANDDDNDYSYVDTSTPAGIAAASGDDYVFNPDDNTVVYDPIVSTGTGTSTGGTGGYEGSTYDEVPDVYTPIDFDDEDYTPTSDELNAAIDAAGGINLTDSDYAADVDYTTTGSGADYTSTATADDDDPYVAPIADPEPPAPPPVFYDALGNPYGSQAEAAAADAAAEAAAAQAAAAMAAAFDEPTPAEIAAANAAAQREAYDDDEYTVMSQPVAPAVTDPTGSDISYADILSGAGVSDEEIDSMRENILTGETDYDLEPLDFSFLDETNELLGELGVAPIDVAALTKVGDTGINLEVANAPAAITEMALGGDDAPITYDGDQALGASGGLDSGRYDFVDDLPDDALDFSSPVNEFDEIDDGTGTDFSAVPTGVGATDDDLATDFTTVSTDTEKDLAFQNYLDGLIDTDFTDPEQTGLEAMEGSISDLPDNLQETRFLPTNDFLFSEIESDAQKFMDSLDGKTEAELIADQGIMMPSDESFAAAEADMSGLDILSDQTNQASVGAEDDEATVAETSTDIPTEQDINQAASTATGQSGSDLYLSAMTKVSDPNYDPNNSNLTEAEQRALYGARGQTPNAAETAYLNDLLGNARHAKDSDIIGKDGEPIYKAGDYVTDQSFMDKVGDIGVSLFDMFFNPLSMFGEDFTIGGQNKKSVQEQLDAYKNGGTFVYGDDGKTVVGIAEANYDADGDGQNDTVVLYDEDGDIQVTGDAVGVEDIKVSNENADGEEFDIDIVDSDIDYTNTEDGVVTSTGEVEQAGDDDGNIPICEEGFEFDPVEGICMPIDTIGDGTGGGGVTLKDRPTSGGGDDVTTPTTPRPTGTGVKIRQPQFNKGGVVTRNIDKFANGGVVTPNIDNFFSSMR